MIPKTNTNLDKTGLILEALAYATYKQLPDDINDYSDLYLRDDYSSEILSKGFGWATCEPAHFLPLIGTYKNALYQAITTQVNADISGLISGSASQAQADLDDFFEE